MSKSDSDTEKRPDSAGSIRTITSSMCSTSSSSIEVITDPELEDDKGSAAGTNELIPKLSPMRSAANPVDDKGGATGTNELKEKLSSPMGWARASDINRIPAAPIEMVQLPHMRWPIPKNYRGGPSFEEEIDPVTGKKIVVHYHYVEHCDDPMEDFPEDYLTELKRLRDAPDAKATDGGHTMVEEDGFIVVKNGKNGNKSGKTDDAGSSKAK